MINGGWTRRDIDGNAKTGIWVPDGSIGTNELADAGVTLAKLATSGFSADDALRFDGSGWEAFAVDIKTASQTAAVSSTTTTIVDITGCSLSLEAGKWIVLGNFASARYWFSDTNAGSKGLTRVQIRNGSNTVLEETQQYHYVPGSVAQRWETPMYLGTLVTLASTTTIKLSGYTYIVTGTNFASGFRRDSGNGLDCSIKAIRIV